MFLRELHNILEHNKPRLGEITRDIAICIHANDGEEEVRRTEGRGELQSGSGLCCLF
jgi:hypothetical protein